MSCFKTILHRVQFCVVGGGLAGVCAAVAAARKGVSVALVHDRPMLGGNASSEVRMWISGAHGENNQETGLIEELNLNNQYRNLYKNYSVWDSIIYEMVRLEPNITLLLNCTCQDGEMNDNRLKSVTCWQLTTQTFHEIEADIFADCSGDSILAPITGAQYTVGRESRKTYGESIAPETADRKTMGMSCLIQAREYPSPRFFIPPSWAEHYTKDDLPHRIPNLSDICENFWYLELGGENDSIADTEKIRDQLLAIAYGIWDFVKNDPEQREKNMNFDLDWMGMLPGKRESRRYVGDYVLTQNDIEKEGKFDDVIAYGGWTMDDHHPSGFRTMERPTIWHPAPSPFGIPYRCIYSKNIDNLMFAGRNISVSHCAMSATRVMATCALLGQAAGTAAAIALKYQIMPRGVCAHIDELRQTLMNDDCYLPFSKRKLSALTEKATLSSNFGTAESLRNGYDRPIGKEDNGWYGENGAYIEYCFDSPQLISSVRLIFDSDLNGKTLPEKERLLLRNMRANIHLDFEKSCVPQTIIKEFDLILILADGQKTVISEQNNYQRSYNMQINKNLLAVRFVPKKTWGSEKYHVFSFDLF